MRERLPQSIPLSTRNSGNREV
jgi:hypothetical protein